MPINLPADIAIDIRQPILGDSFGWAGVEPAAAKKSIVIHGTASEEQNEDGFTMAEYHVNSNGWGGIGVHFVVTKDGYSGRAGQTPGGSQVQYVGDLSTWRAGCLNQNPGRVHMEISGLFTGRTPSEAQLRNARKLIDFLLSPNEILPSLNFHSQVTYHNAVPGQNTSCPGWQYPHFQEWFNYLQGGAEPSWFSTQQAPAPAPTPPPAPAPAPAPTPTPAPTPAPTPTPDVPGSVLDNVPEWDHSYVGKSDGDLQKDPTPQEVRAVVRSDVFAIDMTGDGQPKSVPVGTEVKIAGYFTNEGKQYARTVFNVLTGWPVQHQYYGIETTAFVPEGTDPLAVPIPVNVTNPTADSFSVKLSKFIAAIVGAFFKVIGRKRSNQS